MVECPALRAASQFPQQPVSTYPTWQSTCRPPETGMYPAKRRSNWNFDLYAVRICTLGVLSRTPAAPHLQRHECWIFLIHRRPAVMHPPHPPLLIETPPCPPRLLEHHPMSPSDVRGCHVPLCTHEPQRTRDVFGQCLGVDASARPVTLLLPQRSGATPFPTSCTSTRTWIYTHEADSV